MFVELWQFSAGSFRHAHRTPHSTHIQLSRMLTNHNIIILASILFNRLSQHFGVIAHISHKCIDTHTRIHGDGWWSICFSLSSIQLVPFVGAFLHEMDDLVDCHICSLLAQILCSVCHSFPWPSCPTL